MLFRLLISELPHNLIDLRNDELRVSVELKFSRLYPDDEPAMSALHESLVPFSWRTVLMPSGERMGKLSSRHVNCDSHRSELSRLAMSGLLMTTSTMLKVAIYHGKIRRVHIVSRLKIGAFMALGLVSNSDLFRAILDMKVQRGQTSAIPEANHHPYGS